MSTGSVESRSLRTKTGLLCWAAAGLVFGASLAADTPTLANQRPPTDSHVPELAAFLDRVEIAEPMTYRHLAVYPVLLSDKIELPGQWLTLDAAISRGVLAVEEKGGGSVPVITVQNRSRDQHVFIMAGEVISGGKQTRTVRTDVVVAPGQRIELSVFCVEARRWEGGKQFSAGNVLVPQSIQMELRRGADQRTIWSEIARNNRALEAENATGSLEIALRSKPVQDKLSEVRRAIVPGVPQGTVGFIFTSRGRAVGAEFFGREDFARQLLPKLLDSYGVDFVLLSEASPERHRGGRHDTAVEFFKRVAGAGSQRTGTPGSGAGIRTRTSGLLGDGVSLGGTLVHYGVQPHRRIFPRPDPPPVIPFEQRGERQQPVPR